MRHALTGIAVLALAAACATPGLPPGGPTVSAFPRVIATLPDTNAVNVKPGKVLIRYDDVIGEQANGGELSKSVLISPWDGEPRVQWKRTGMTVHPRGDWRPNTAYTITILPGIGDLKGKPSPFGYVLRFSTGPSIPKTTIRGVAFDWVLARAVAKTTIQAIDVKDTTLIYLTAADSTGRFELSAMPAGTYIVRAIDERTANRTLEPREAWDTATVTITDSARTDLYMFVHDTIPPRIAELRLNDSISIALTMDKPLMPGVPIPATAVRVVGSDSTAYEVASVLTAEEERIARELADSIARTKDTTQRAPAGIQPPRRTIDPNRRRDTVAVLAPPVSARKAPTTDIVIKMRAPLKPAASYRITVTGLRNLLDREGTATRVLIVPKPPPVDSTKREPGDSIRKAIPPAQRPTPPTRPPR